MRRRTFPARAWALAAATAAALLVPGAARAAATWNLPVRGTLPRVDEAGLQDFYPSASLVHVGDQVDFNFAGVHTVPFLPGDEPPRDVQPPPLVVPTGTGTYPITNDAAGNPFWWGGVVPIL